MTPQRHVFYLLDVLQDCDVLMLELHHLKFPKANLEEVHDVFFKIKNHASLYRTYLARIIIKDLTRFNLQTISFNAFLVYIIYCYHLPP